MNASKIEDSSGHKDQHVAEYNASHIDMQQSAEVLNKTTAEGSNGQQQENSQLDTSQQQDMSDKIPEMTDEEEKTLRRLEDNEDLRRRIAILEEENRKLQDELRKKEATIIQLQAKTERIDTAELQKKIAEQRAQIERLMAQDTHKKEECDRYCKERDELDGKLKQYEHLLNPLKEKNMSLKKEKDELLNRLSKIASDRLTHENTDITDLSDEIRPTKLAEKMSELYDNQWTNAFDELKTNNHVEEETIRTLLTILMETHQVCKEMTLSRYQQLKEICSSVEFSSSADDEDKPKNKTTMKNKFSIPLQHDIKRIWRESCKTLFKEASPIIEKKVADKLGFPFLKMRETAVYLKECVELCWMMYLQEKPMHLDISVHEKDGHPYFDSDKFRSYTKTGQYIAFVVWPTLYLFEGGPLLKKGVAQGSIVANSTVGQDDSCSCDERL